MQFEINTRVYFRTEILLPILPNILYIYYYIYIIYIYIIFEQIGSKNSVLNFRQIRSGNNCENEKHEINKVLKC